MKKIVIVAALASGLALAACGGNKADTVSNSSTTQVLDNGATVTSNSTTKTDH